MADDYCEDLENWFRTNSAISIYIGYGADSQVYYSVADEDATLPHVLFEEVGGDSEEHLQGSAGLCMATIQVSAYDETAKKSGKLAELIRKQLKAHHGLMGSTFVTEVSCSGHRSIGSERDVAKGQDHKYFTMRVFDIWHSETT